MPSKVINWGLFFILSLIWGSSFVLMKEGMKTLTPYHVATLRILSAGVILIPFAAKAFRAIPKNKLALVMLSGLIGNFFPAYLFCIAETNIDTSLAGILNALTPLFAIVVGKFFFEMKVSRRKAMGVVIGFLGLCLLFVSNGHIDLTNFSYSALILIATLLYGINVNMVGKYLHGIGSINIASVAFVSLVIPCIVILYFLGYFSLPLSSKPFLISTAASCVLGTMGTAVATILFYMLLKRAGTLFASTVTYGIPFVAVLWGLLLGEHTTLMQVACLGMILVGVYLANRNSKE